MGNNVVFLPMIKRIHEDVTLSYFVVMKENLRGYTVVFFNQILSGQIKI